MILPRRSVVITDSLDKATLAVSLHIISISACVKYCVISEIYSKLILPNGRSCKWIFKASILASRSALSDKNPLEKY